MYKAMDWLHHRSGWARRQVNRFFYNYLAGIDRAGLVTLMNYGYAHLNGNAQPLLLDDGDEADRFGLQLYQRVASAIDLHGKDVLEVGSGRGGGASFVRRYLGPRTMTGVDYSQQAVAFCQRHYKVDGLRYLYGDAENLPLDARQFDAVINVESSHCYALMGRFLGEVRRVLKPGGHLLWADHRKAERVEAVKAGMCAAGFHVLCEEVISPNVLEAMRLHGQRNRDLIDGNVPKLARSIFYHFAGIEGTQIYNQIAAGELVYMRMAMQTVE